MERESGYLKKTYFIILLIIAIVSLVVAVASPFVWRESVDNTNREQSEKINENTESIKRLQEELRALDELKFNLKQYMYQKGYKYIELKENY
jgi:flagellar basal body-associated protein FliL